MKSLFICIYLILCQQYLIAQVRAYKFESLEDRHYYQKLEEAITNGYELDSAGSVIITGIPNEERLTLEEIRSLMKLIKKTPYLKQKENKNYSSYAELNKNPDFSSIRKLSLSGDSIKKLPFFKLMKCKNLKTIELINTSIKKLPWWINWKLVGLDKLKTFKIYNYDNQKAFRFSKNTTLRKLVYRYSPFSPAPINLHKLKNIKEIDMVQNDIILSKNLNLHLLDSLKSLNLSKNKISIENLAKDTVHSIKKLILSYNKLTHIPAEIAYFKNVRDLQLAKNYLTAEKISPKIQLLDSLEILSFYKNELTYLPSFLLNYKNLFELDLYFNKINEVPDSLSNLKNLKFLYLANNKIYYLPKSIGNLTKLKELYIHHNRISTLPNSICNLSNLTDFHIQNNYFNSFPSCILNLKSLEDLDISFNDIQRIPPEIASLHQLKYFWMRGINLVATSKEEALAMRDSLQTLQERGVKVSVEPE